MNHWLRDPFYWATLAGGVGLVLLARLLLGPGARPVPLELLLLVVCYPLLEEFLFRGLLQPWLLARTRAYRVGPITLANVLTSLLFALVHVPARGGLHGLLVFVPSLAFGYFRDRHDSLWPAVVLHASWNAAAVLLLGRATAPL